VPFVLHQEVVVERFHLFPLFLVFQECGAMTPWSLSSSDLIVADPRRYSHDNYDNIGEKIPSYVNTTIFKLLHIRGRTASLQIAQHSQIPACTHLEAL
jgi:hypothetical protein